MILGILKGISTACIAAICYIIGYTLCHAFGEPQTDFLVGMIFGIVSMGLSNIVNVVVGGD